eukprot:tig00000237_g20489.t1
MRAGRPAWERPARPAAALALVLAVSLQLSLQVAGSAERSDSGVSPEDFREGSFRARVPSIIRSADGGGVQAAADEIVPLGRNSVPASAIAAAAGALRAARAPRLVYSLLGAADVTDRLQRLVEHSFVQESALVLYAVSPALEVCAAALEHAPAGAGRLCVPVPDRIQPDNLVLWALHAALTAAAGAPPSAAAVFLSLDRRLLDAARAAGAVAEAACDVHLAASPAGELEALAVAGGAAARRVARAAADAIRRGEHALGPAARLAGALELEAAPGGSLPLTVCRPAD